ncbi:MAG TPA: hypothetical protein VGL53_16665 [Bryobacteraceae bacterium]|jgi:hypothetical protein
MRYGLLLMLVPLVGFAASDEADAIAVVEKTFQGMAAHDGDMIRATMLPDARLYGSRDGSVPTGRSVEEFVKGIVAAKMEIAERFTAHPQVSVRGNLAQVWGEYEFLREGKVGHCGVDSASLFKGPDGWKIATITYTMETTGCKK